MYTTNTPVRDLLQRWCSSLGFATRDLPADPFAAVLTILQLGSESSHPRAFGIVSCSELADPYPAVVGAVAPELPNLVCAMQVSQLVCAESEDLTDAALYFDPIADPKGQHRVYLRDQTSLPGIEWGVFVRLEDAVEWMLGVAEGAVPDVPPPVRDQWEQSARSGGEVLERLLEEELPALWRGPFPRGGEPPEVAIDPDDRGPGWARRMCLLVLQWAAVEGVVPDLSMVPLPPQQRRFVDHITQLCAERAP